MDLELKGKRALVTGSSSGIGAAIAKALAREGAVVAVHGRNAERAHSVADDIRQSGRIAWVALGDLAEDGSAAEVASSVLSQMGGVDILVNNAGGRELGSGKAAWLDVSPADWVTIFQQNAVAAIRMIHHFAPGMKERGWGRIIQIASEVVVHPWALMPDYQAAKAALVNLSGSLARSLAGTGITVNTISPGMVAVDPLESWLDSLVRDRAWGDHWREVEPRVAAEIFSMAVGRIGRPDDIAAAAAFLASPLAAFITGANLHVDGGQQGH